MDNSRTEPGPPPRSEPAPDSALPLTMAFELLARAPRRRLLYQLHENDEPATSVDALAQQLCEEDGTGHASDEADPRRTRVALHHVHLPKLDDADVVKYDPTGGEVRYLGDPRLGALIEWGLGEEGAD